MAQFADIETDVLYSTVISVRPALNNCQATGRETWEVCVASNIEADCKVNFQVPSPSSSSSFGSSWKLKLFLQLLILAYFALNCLAVWNKNKTMLLGW